MIQNRSFLFLITGFVVSFLVAGCAVSDVGPINRSTSQLFAFNNHFVPDHGDDGAMIIGLAFSGGGTRAAAFGYGVMRALDDTIVDEYPYERSLVDNIRIISGVSGGAVLAAYFGMKGRDDYRDFRETFLVRNAEERVRTNALSPAVAIGVLNGGANDRSSLARWLDDNIFHGATYSKFDWSNAPSIWISASDIYNRVPFHFSVETFAALCSNLKDVRIADAVAASAAVPVVFKPISVASNHGACTYRQPDWLSRVMADPEASYRLKAYGRALHTYRSSNVNFIKLLDGALTDNLGLTPFAMARASAQTPYGPLSPADAVKLKTFLYIVVDAGREMEYPWVKELQGPGISEILGAVTDTAISSSVREGFDALKLATTQWRDELIAYRCSQSAATVARYRGSLKGWNCRDVRFHVQRLSIQDLPAGMAASFNEVPTRFVLPTEQVDQVIAAGRVAFKRNAVLQNAIREVQSDAGVKKPVSPNLLQQNLSSSETLASGPL